jgi:hypothetical protein
MEEDAAANEGYDDQAAEDRDDPDQNAVESAPGQKIADGFVCVRGTLRSWLSHSSTLSGMDFHGLAIAD